jgi:hypothetical protein
MSKRKPKMSIGGSPPQEPDELIKRASRGDDAASQTPCAKIATDSENWKENLELDTRSEQAIITRITNADKQQSELLTRTVKAVRARLSGAAATQQQQRQVDWLVQSWLICCEADEIFIESLNPWGTDQAQALDNLNAAHYRLLEAIVELATVRRQASTADRESPLERPSRETRSGLDCAGPLAGQAATPATRTPGALDSRGGATRQRDSPGGKPARERGAKSMNYRDDLDLAARREQSCIARILYQDRMSPNMKVKEALILEMRTLKAKLDGPAPGLLRCMLVDRIVISILQCVCVDVRYTEWSSCDQRLSAPAHHRIDSTLRIVGWSPRPRHS